MQLLNFIFLVFAFFVILNSAWAAPQAESFLGRVKAQIKSDTNLQKAAIYVALNQRCLRYFLPLDRAPLTTKLGCERETKRFLLSLDLEVLKLHDANTGEDGFTTVVFRKELLEMMAQRRTYVWLNEIESQLQMSAVVPFDLYQASFRVFKKDGLVVQTLGVLLQDTSAGHAHLAYLSKWAEQNKPNALFRANLDKLKSVLGLLTRLQTNFKWQKDYQLYPVSVEKRGISLSAVQYHYYVLAHNTGKMVSVSEKKDAVKIFFMNVAFNYLYEVMNTMKASKIFSDNYKVSRAADRDILLGYLGALHGVGIHPRSLEKFSAPSKNAEVFFKTAIAELREFFPHY